MVHIPTFYIFLNDLTSADYPRVVPIVMNPKCVSLGELYGQFNTATHEWEDGLMGDIMQQCVTDRSSSKKWIIFDGPVDALWIESITLKNRIYEYTN